MPATKSDEEHGWNVGNLHEQTLWCSWERKPQLFDNWAETYEQDLEDDYVAPSNTAAIVLHLAKTGYSTSSPALRMLDAGCGTGLVGVALKNKIEAPRTIHLTGLDFSPKMLRIAKGRKCYQELTIADLNEPLPVADESQDFVLSVGVFLKGYCGPRAVPNLLRTVRPGGYFVATIRSASFKEDEEAYMQALSESGFEVIQNEVKPYLGPVTANYLTCQKVL